MVLHCLLTHYVTNGEGGGRTLTLTLTLTRHRHRHRQDIHAEHTTTRQGT